MKLFKVFALYGACILVCCCVKISASEATNNLNDIDFSNNRLSSITNTTTHSTEITTSTTTTTTTDDITGRVSHFRGKRFIAFPVGSSFSTAVCMTTGVIGNPNYQYLSLGLNWGIAYELPNSTWVLQHANGFGTKHSADVLAAKIQRRHRRDLYGKLETLINGTLFKIGTTLTGMDVVAHVMSNKVTKYAYDHVAVCFTVGIIGNPYYSYMSFGLNWGVAYDLPNTTWILNHLHGFAKRPIPVSAWHRRSRRYLYGEIERVVDNMGYNGRDCVLRALCESQQYFQNSKMGMIGEMLRVVFSLPKQRIFKRELDENPDIAVYDKAYRKARSLGMDCSSQYECSFSLLELAFGKYSQPPAGYYKEH